MRDLHSVLVAIDKNEISVTQAEFLVASWGKEKIKRELVAAGLVGAPPPESAAALAKILLPLHSGVTASNRITGPRTLDALIGEKLFADDPPELKRRFAVKRDDGVDIFAVHTGPDGPPLLQKELELNRADISKRTLELARKQEGEGQGTHIPEDDLDIGNPEIVKIGNRYYYRADIKVVLWIPYRRNTFPVPTRFEPEHWKSPDMSQEMRMAARAMLSTGNPTPPDTFPDYQSWSKFWQSSEYRGIYNLKLFICCPDQDSKEARDAGHKSGYTPAPADVDPNPPETLTKRLTDDHKDRQNVGSIVEGLMQGATGNELTHWLTFPVGDQYEDALDLIKELCPKTNESYSEGEQIFEHTKADDCVSGTVKFMVRVGKAHNLLNYLATGKLIGFQGGILTYKLCCDGKLKLSYKHSAIPSQRIYVNNRTVYDYDMLNAKVPWSQVEESYYGVSAGVLEGSKAALKRRLLEKVESPLNKNEQTETAIPRGDGCPSPIPDDWLFDSA